MKKNTESTETNEHPVFVPESENVIHVGGIRFFEIMFDRYSIDPFDKNIVFVSRTTCLGYINGREYIIHGCNNRINNEPVRIYIPKSVQKKKQKKQTT